MKSQTPLKLSNRQRQAGFCEILKSSWGIPDGLIHVLHYVPLSLDYLPHDDVMQWNHFPCYWPFVRGIHRLPVDSTHKDQWRGALMFSLICAWTNDWANNRNADDLRRHRAHYDVTVMKPCNDWSSSRWCCNVWPLLETHLKLKSREIAFACNFLLEQEVTCKRDFYRFSAAKSFWNFAQSTASLWSVQIFQNYYTTEIDVLGEISRDLRLRDGCRIWQQPPDLGQAKGRPYTSYITLTS